MVGTAIEGEGQFSTGVVLAKHHVGNGLSTLFASVPCLYDGIGIVGLGHHGDGTARAVDEHHALACLLQGSHQLALHAGQFNVSAVAATESFLVDLHLLTFQAGRDTAYKDNDIGIAYLADNLVSGADSLLGYIETEESQTYILNIVNLNAVFLPGLHAEGE